MLCARAYSSACQSQRPLWMRHVHSPSPATTHLTSQRESIGYEYLMNSGEMDLLAVLHCVIPPAGAPPFMIKRARDSEMVYSSPLANPEAHWVVLTGL